MLSLVSAVVALGMPLATPDLRKLEARLNPICKSFRGRMGYSLKLLKGGGAIGFREDERFPTASTIKTAVMVEVVNQVEEGKLKWTDKRPLPPADRREASMWSFYFRDGTALDLDGWVNLMIGVSDNTATILLREWLTPDAINARMAKLGLPNTKILWNGFPAGSAERRLRGQFGLGVTTPREMRTLLELIATGKAAGKAGCDKMLRILSKQYWDDAIAGSVPPWVRVSSKSGAINRSRSDSAVVFGRVPYVLTIYTDSQKDQRWTSENEGDRALVKLSQTIWNHLNPGDPYLPPKGFEKFAPTGGGA